MAKLDEFLRSLSDSQLNGLCRFCGMPEEEIEALTFKPDTRSAYERLRDQWNDPVEAARLKRAGFNREGMLAAYSKGDSNGQPQTNS